MPTPCVVACSVRHSMCLLGLHLPTYLHCTGTTPQLVKLLLCVARFGGNTCCSARSSLTILLFSDPQFALLQDPCCVFSCPSYRRRIRSVQHPYLGCIQSIAWETLMNALLAALDFSVHSCTQVIVTACSSDPLRDAFVLQKEREGPHL